METFDIGGSVHLMESALLIQQVAGWIRGADLYTPMYQEYTWFKERGLTLLFSISQEL